MKMSFLRVTQVGMTSRLMMDVEAGSKENLQ